jgi:hypothetical protein
MALAPAILTEETPRALSTRLEGTTSEASRSSLSQTGILFSFLATFVLCAVPLVVAIRPIAAPVCDPDLWWHLRVGEWVVQHGSVPETDPFSAYGQGKKWVAYSWLYEVLLYELNAVFGLAGIIIYRAALSLAIGVAVQRLIMRNRPTTPGTACLAAVSLLALAMLFSERPWLFTILFGTLTLHAVLDMREGRFTLLAWLLPVIFIVWANVHIQFVYGLALLLLGCIAPLIDRVLMRGDQRTPATVGRPGWRLYLVTVLCFLATLVNPYRAELYRVVIEYATQPGPFQFVNELKAPDFREVTDWAMIGLLGGAAFALGRRRRLSSFDVLLLIGGAYLSLRSRRDLWVGVLAAASILSSSGFLSDPTTIPPRWQLRYRVAFAAMLVFLAIGLCVVRDLSANRLERTVSSVFPVAAARFVEERGYTGPLYNDFNWGGYFIRALPELPVAIDGRTNLHGDERLLRFGATIAGAPGWSDDPDLAKAGIVIVDVRTPLASLLKGDARFALVFEDDIARVFIARGQATH